MSKKPLKPSDGELEILQVLWNSPNISVREVHAILQNKRDIGYTTVLKQMQRMLEKKMLSRNEHEKPHRYTALLDEASAKRNIFAGLSDALFQGSAMELVMHALGNQKTSPEELAQLKEWIKKQEENE